MLPVFNIELLIADVINGAANGTYRAPTFPWFNDFYISGDYQSVHSFLTAGYYYSSQSWSGATSVVMRGDPIMAKGEYGRNDISAGSGNDFIYSATANYLVGRGNAGNDIIITHDSGDLFGDDGNDVLVAGVDINGNASGNYLLTWKSLLANANNMTESALNSHFTIIDSKSMLCGGNGDDILIAPGDGNNTLYGDEMSTTPKGGNDMIIAGNGNNVIYGGGGNDTIYVGSGQNEIYGGDGDDLVYADDIGDKHDGGNGFDIYSFAYKDSAIKFETTFWDKTINFEGVVGTVFNDNILGSSANDYINGYIGNDILDGGNGNDLIYGGSGNDSIWGGIGNDSLYGDDGHDTMRGGDGNDIFTGGAGNDDLHGETGDDFYLVSGAFGSDFVFENAGEGTDDRVIFNDITLGNVLYGRGGNDLVFADPSMTNGVTIKDWFVNFGVDSFWFTAGAGQYNYVTAEIMAGAFGVTIPTGNTAINSLDTLTFANASPSDSMMNVGDDLSHLAVTVTGVDFLADATPPIC